MFAALLLGRNARRRDRGSAVRQSRERPANNHPGGTYRDPVSGLHEAFEATASVHILEVDLEMCHGGEFVTL